MRNLLLIEILNNFLIKSKSQNNSTIQPSKIVYIELPYVQEIFDQLSKEINSFFQKFCTNIQLSSINATCKLK